MIEFIIIIQNHFSLACIMLDKNMLRINFQLARYHRGNRYNFKFTTYFIHL